MKRNAKKVAAQTHACLECGGELVETRTTQPYRLVGDWGVLVEGAILVRCRSCSYFGIAFEDVEAIERAAAAAVVAKPSRLSGPEIKFLRARLELDGRHLARRLGVTPPTLSRWENDREPIGQTAETALRALVALKEKNQAGFDPSILEHISPQAEGPLKLVLRQGADGGWHRVAA